MRDTHVELWDEATEASLYALYCESIEQRRAEIVERTVAGEYRDWLLNMYRPLPLEHFEAKLDALRGSPAEYEAAVESLRRGFVPRRRCA